MFARKFTWMAAVVGVTIGGAEAGAQEAPAEQQQTPEQGSAPVCRTLEEKVLFKTDSAMADVEKRKLDAVSAWLAADPQRSVVVKGSADPRGSASYNEALSFRRAQAVEGVLVAQGADPLRVIAMGEGEQHLNGPNDPEARSATMLLCQAPTVAAAPAPEPAPPTAAAMAEPEPAPAYTEAPITEQATPPQSTMDRIGLGVALGGGVVGFTDDEARDLTDIGGSWEFRAILGSKMPLALELAYLGSAQGIEAVGISNDARLIGNGGEGVLRLQLPTFFVRPYVLAGVGWTHYQLTNEGINVSGLSSSDDVLTVPLGLGLTFRGVFGGTFDIRGTYRLSYFDDMFSGVYGGANVNMNTWAATARLGWEF